MRQTMTLTCTIFFVLIFLAGCSVTDTFEIPGTEHLSCSPEVYLIEHKVVCERHFSGKPWSYTCQVSGKVENVGEGIAVNLIVQVEYGEEQAGIRNSTFRLLGDLPPNQGGEFDGEISDFRAPASYDIWVKCDKYVPPAQVEEPPAATEPPVNSPAMVATQPAALDWSVGVHPGFPLLIPRTSHTATLLKNGKVLLAGGSLEPDDFVADEELFEPLTGKSSWAAPLHTVRHGHTATLLLDGRVLVVGGYNLPQQWLGDAEIYDPDADTWTVIPSLFPHGVSHTATLMADGRVLVVGGCIGDGVCTEKVEIFDPANNAWFEAEPLPADLASQTAQLLMDGRVLIAGGSGDNIGSSIVDDGATYDPKTNSWAATGSMIARRHLPESVRLKNGKVLVVGGFILGDPTNSNMTNVTEIYDPGSNTWSRAADMNVPRYDFILILLKDSRILAIGGANRWDNNWDETAFVPEVEMYDPAKDQWSVIGLLPQPTSNATGILLPNGIVWVAGGNYGVSGSIFPPETWFIVPPTP